ncbi:hypothetical protein FNF29_03000 [Cafeteria roenbergensis]|uniref:Lecithin:cholesterol acyltransferase n=1 Tax=Cafeteria roenbergensis TaxID=33653 RepID=A0A5A8CKJ5_CAFRO|nr:hypothetical protein FNF29_03000 [Cafeteria roenbergensis]|eukprot:KAA0153612.1 hypothetical protein FNF29_03000 [Cafeteria roenbergensis]
MRLDNETGLDPPGVRLRVASGLAAADVVMGAYSLWAGLVQQLAALGYDESSVHLAAYDWRVRFDLLEERDAYFTALKAKVELMSDLAGGKPVVFVSHSMGFNVLSYFLQWVHSRAATGRQCPHLPLQERLDRESRHPQREVDGALPPACDGWWARRYVRTWVNLAGSAAGAPKGLLAWYSGQMGNLASMGPLFSAMLETYLPKRSLRYLWRSFQSMTALIPMGGVRVWGGRSGAGGTRAPFSGWARDQSLSGPGSPPADGGPATRPVAGDADANADADAGAAHGRTLSPRVTVAAPVAADTVRRAGLDRSMRWFAAPDEPAANGPATRGIVSLRRVVSWERQDPGAVVEMLLASLGSYLPAVWASGDGNASATTASLGGLANTTAAARDSSFMAESEARSGSGQSARGGAARKGGKPIETADDAASASAKDGSVARVADATGTRARWAAELPAQRGLGPDAGHERARRSNGLRDGSTGDDGGTEASLGGRCRSRLGGPPASNSSADSLVGALLLDVMRVQDPAFMRVIDGYVDLNAWRPPTAAELAAYELQVPEGAWLRDGARPGSPPDRGTAASGRTTPDEPPRYRPTAGGLPRRLWANALAVPLPDAPGLSVVCMYGVGRAVERHYNMLAVRAAPGTPWEALEDSVAAGNDTIAGADGSEAVPLPVEIATGFSREPEAGVLPRSPGAGPSPGSAARGRRAKGSPGAGRPPLSGAGWPRGRSSPGRVSSGITFTDGDGTVPAVSMGLLCERHFRSRQGNPGRASVVTRELPFGSAAGGIDELLRGVPDTVSGELFAEANGTPPIAMAGMGASGNAGPIQEPAAGGTSEAAQWLEHVSHAGLVRGTVDYIRAQGGQTSEHVDILLNRQVMQTVLMEAAGRTGLSPQDRRLSERTRATLARATPALEGLTPWDASDWEGSSADHGA